MNIADVTVVTVDSKKRPKIVEIDGNEYVLKYTHQTKDLGGNAIGGVPVKHFAKASEWQEWVATLSGESAKEAHSAWAYGEGVELQKRARKDAAGTSEPCKEGSPEYNKTFNQVPAETLIEYHGRHDELVGYIQSVYFDSLEESEDSYDEDYVWSQYCK